MNPCPYCSAPPHLFDTPYWHYASNTSRAKGSPHFFWVCCTHAATVCARDVAIPAAERAAVEAAWAAESKALFDTYTQHWTEVQRTSYRARLHPKPVDEPAARTESPPAPDIVYPEAHDKPQTNPRPTAGDDLPLI